MTIRVDTPIRAVLNHQKLRQPTYRRTEADEIGEYQDGTAPEGGTQWDPVLVSLSHATRSHLDLPDEIAEAKNENGDSSKLDHIVQITVEVLDVIRKHGGEGKRPQPLDEGNTAGGGDAQGFPHRTPVEWIMRIRRRLRHQDMRATFDEMVRADVGHDLGARQDFHVELLLDLVELLS
nr:hypothetical protein CFP56_04010 [Quercus suber]